MKEEDKIYQKFGREPGFRTPDGYFDDFIAKMHESLPAYPEKPKVPDLSRWQRIRPYVYLAAMFCGIWCMMKIFSDVSTRVSGESADVPESVVLAMSDHPTAEYVIETGYDDKSEDSYTLQTEMCEMYENIDDFKSDFERISPEGDKES